jgi:hypothetical protein
MRVITHPARQSDRRVARELLLRAAAVALATVAILGLLPAIAGAAT